MPKSISIYIPDELVEKMARLPEVNWSEIARQCIEDYIEKRKQPSDVKQQILRSDQIRCIIMPLRFRPQDKDFDIVFELTNSSEEDTILDRIVYHIDLARENGSLIGSVRGAHLMKRMLKHNDRISCLEKLSAHPEILEGISQIVGKKGIIKWRIDATAFLESPKGIIETYVFQEFRPLFVV